MRRGCDVRKLSSFQDYGRLRLPPVWRAGRWGAKRHTGGGTASRCTPQAGTPAFQGERVGRAVRGYLSGAARAGGPARAFPARSGVHRSPPPPGDTPPAGSPPGGGGDRGTGGLPGMRAADRQRRRGGEENAARFVRPVPQSARAQLSPISHLQPFRQVGVTEAGPQLRARVRFPQWSGAASWKNFSNRSVSAGV